MVFIPGPEDVVLAYAAGTKLGQVIIQGGKAYIKPATDKAKELGGALVEMGGDAYHKMLIRVKGKDGQQVVSGGERGKVGVGEGDGSKGTPNVGARSGATDGELIGQPYRFDPKDFSNNRKLDASDVNQAHTNNSGTDFIPYKNGTFTTERYLQPGEKFYSVEYTTQSAPGGWAT